jgi:quercetin dioxygenase-like cupin family protein
LRNEKEDSVDYTFLANLQQEFVLPEKGILSRVLHKDEHVNVILFGFSAGQELSAHSAPTPAVLYFLEGEAEVQLGDDKVQARPGSFVYIAPDATPRHRCQDRASHVAGADERPVAVDLKLAWHAPVFNRERTLPTVKE